MQITCALDNEWTDSTNIKSSLFSMSCITMYYEPTAWTRNMHLRKALFLRWETEASDSTTNRVARNSSQHSGFGELWWCFRKGWHSCIWMNVNGCTWIYVDYCTWNKSVPKTTHSMPFGVEVNIRPCLLGGKYGIKNLIQNLLSLQMNLYNINMYWVSLNAVN